LRRLAKSEGGFGLVELLIAMTVMAIAIMGIVAVFSSGFLALNRASHVSNAGVVADKQMEAFRKVRFTDPSLAPGCLATTTCLSAATTVTGPDNRSYDVRTQVQWYCATATIAGTFAQPQCSGAEPTKLVTIVVYDHSTGNELFRESSNFDQATG
jgi:type II secretory pathway pseudopilin PulG